MRDLSLDQINVTFPQKVWLTKSSFDSGLCSITKDIQLHGTFKVSLSDFWCVYMEGKQSEKKYQWYGVFKKFNE